MPPSAAPKGSVSVLIPTYQGAEFLERVLARLASQRFESPWDVLVVDSGSTDGTLEILGRVAPDFPVPLRVRRIHKAEFDHGDTRNLLAAESAGEILVYLTQDAIPASDDWLATLVANFGDPKVGAAYCRNVPRPDADPATKLLCRDDPGYASERSEVRLPPPEEYERLNPHERRLLYNFNDVASALRRDLWKRHPFPRTWFGEDVLLARAVLEAGYTVVYDAGACVEHSHDYDAAETLSRARVDGRFNAEWLGRICIETRQDVDALCRRYAASDREAVEGLGLAAEEARGVLARLTERRRAAFQGLFEGGRSALRMPRSRVLPEDRPINVLYVVHGFPPDTWAGTEVYTLELARAVQDLGHRVTILCRTPGEVGEGETAPADFALLEDEFEGLRVLRMVNKLDLDDMRSSFEHPRGEQTFERVLDELAPDVVHFQHLLHFSAGLVDIARRRGVPTIVTCNDYWALCARVQLIRPDGVRCDENQGMGCLVCVKEKDCSRIPFAKAVFPWLRPFVSLVGVLANMMVLPSVKAERFLRKRRIPLQRRVRAWKDLEHRNDFVAAMYARADLCIAPSRFLRGRHLATGLFDPHRFVYSDYGMRTDRLAPVERTRDPEGRVRFGFVGSLVWYKGVDVLVKAMNRLAGRPAVLNVFGDFRPDEEPHHAELAALAATDNVVFHGRFDNDDVRAVYKEIDVLVVPSIWFENSPITIHEAFLLRRPIVTSDIGGMAELVTDGTDGLHFRVGDAADLSRVLSRFLDQPDLIDRLSREFPPVKDIAENGREMEYRYRGLMVLEERLPLVGAKADGPAQREASPA